MEWLIIALIVILSALLFIKYNMSKATWNNSYTCLVGKTVLVTGSNIGIGYYTALDFAKRGARVILACRNKMKAEEAQAKIIKATGNSNVIVGIVDLASLDSVRKFTNEINDREERLDILVNNAGVGCNDHAYTADGLSLTMQSNHFGPFLLTILLIDLLKRSAPSRVVNVSSSMATIGQIDVNDLNRPIGTIFSKIIDYSNTKLCNLLFTIELANKLNNTSVTANALHPGAVQTDFLKQPKTFGLKLLKIAVKLFYKTTKAGAQTPIYVSVSKDVEGITGSYFVECKEKSMPRAAQNLDLSRQLWKKSEELVKLTNKEKQCLK